MTPKSLLRHKQCVSNIENFSKENSFHRVMWDHSLDPKTKGFIINNDDRVVICYRMLSLSTNLRAYLIFTISLL